MSLATYVLRIKISRNRGSKVLYLDQEKYIDKVLKRLNMSDYRPVDISINKGVNVSKKMCPQNEAEWRKLKIFRMLKL